MLRLVVALAIAGVVLPAPPVDARPSSSSSKQAKKKKKKQKKRSSRSTRATKRTKANLPKGYVWPPNARMKAQGKACREELDTLGVAWKKADKLGKVANPVWVPAMEIGGIKFVSYFRKPPFTIDCQLVSTLAKIAPALVELGVREIKFSSFYRNTKVRVGGKTKNLLSRHALGLAMDVISFTDDTGRVVVVKTDYPGGDPLLLAVEDLVNSSGMFRLVLTPKNDPRSHHDHFHIEAAVDYAR